MMKHRLIDIGYLRLLAVQLSVVAVITMMLYWVAGSKQAYSALLGGMICIIPSCLFAANAFKHRGARAAKKIVMRFYLGEALKLGLTFILFTLVFIFIPINALAFFATFITAQLLHWLSLFVLRT